MKFITPLLPGNPSALQNLEPHQIRGAIKGPKRGEERRHARPWRNYVMKPKLFLPRRYVIANPFFEDVWAHAVFVTRYVMFLLAINAYHVFISGEWETMFIQF